MAKEFKTDNKLEYNFIPITSGELHFKVRAPNDAHVALTTGPTEGDPMYEIFIGGWKNTKSVIRRNRVKPDKAEVDTPYILSNAEYRGFWIRWKGGLVEVGKESEVTPFLKWKDPEPFCARYFGICTGWGASGSWITEEFTTENKLEYNFIPITSGELHFKVRAPNDAHVALTTGPTEGDPMYEIFIGGWKNTKSVIRRNRVKPDKAEVDTPYILSNAEYRGFWIRWKDGLVEVGKEREVTPFLKWKDPEPFCVRYFGICTGWGASGSWITEEFETENKLEYHFSPTISRKLHFKVRAPHDAQVALAAGPTKEDKIYEIFIGGWKNTKSVIRRNRVNSNKAVAATPYILSNAEYRGFWIRWEGGLVEVGKESEVTPFLKWKDPQPICVRYYGICTGWGATGSWITEEIKTENNLQYQFSPVTSGKLHFKVRAPNDAHVALATGPNEAEPMHEVFIGGWKNTKSVIRRNRVKPDKAEVDTPYILSNAEYRGFWIRWKHGLVEVGKEGEVIPFLKWKDPEPFCVRYFGICTGWGASGSWITEEFTTENKLEYNFIPLTSGNLNFKVRAPNDAHVALTTGPTEGDPMYEIFIGGWKNTKSVIRRNRVKPDKAEVDTPYILSNAEYRGFWIRWKDGLVEVGKEGEVTPFLKWKDRESFYVRYYGICTGWGASGSWITEEFKTEDKLEYHFSPVKSGKLNFKVRAPNDAHVALTTGPAEGNPMYEIFIGGWRNTKSVIRRNRMKPDKAVLDTPYILSNAEYRGFWIRWMGGLVEVGKESEVTPFLKWKDPEPFYVRYYGICTGWGASGSWVTESE